MRPKPTLPASSHALSAGSRADEAPWSLPATEVARLLGADPALGLSPSEAASRIAREGANELPARPGPGAWIRFARQLASPMILVLAIAIGISLLLGRFADGLAIAAIVLLNALFGFFQENRAESAIAALKALSTPRARVLRSGEAVSVPARDLAPGDVILLEGGDSIPADARLLVASRFSVDEAPLTGESLPVEKGTDPVAGSLALGDRANMVHSGTFATTGSAKAIVVATGASTELGRVAHLIEEGRPGPTPLQARLDRLGRFLIVGFALLVAIVGASSWLRGAEPTTVFLTAITLAVAAIPEGLPAVVTIALALAVGRMAKRNAIVRQLAAVEALGSADVICSDKTGTLTTGIMTARELMLPVGKILRAERGLLSSRSREGGIPASDPLADPLSDLLRCATLCSNAALSKENGSQSRTASGDPTEVALLELADLAGFSRDGEGERIRELPFDSDRKRMSVVTRGPGGAVLWCKGAPESVLAICAPSGAALSTEENARALTQANAWASEGRRVLAFARSTEIPANVSRGGSGELGELEERGLRFLGLIALVDPPRPESRDAIRACQEAGVRVVMITGDHAETGRRVATELGIAGPGKELEVVTGEALDRMGAPELQRAIRDASVFARVSPEGKLRIVRAWKTLGKIAAMTGDGVNDAPALKEASIGIAMGQRGSEVARQVSGIVLADDCFASVAAAVEEGRAVYGNIRRALAYLLSGNLAEVLVMLYASLAGFPAPLVPTQILWINLVTDGLPALALAAEPVPSESLSRRSVAPAPLGARFFGEIAIVATLTAALCFVVYAYSLGAHPEQATTHAFSYLVFSELFRSFAYRSDHATFLELDPRRNRTLAAAVLAPVAIQIAMHHSTLFRTAFSVERLSWADCGWLLLLAAVPLGVLELRKVLRRLIS